MKKIIKARVNTREGKHTHKYFSIVSTQSLSDKRKTELLTHLLECLCKKHTVQLSKKHTNLIEALGKVRLANGVVDLLTVEPIVLILAQVAWDSLVRRGNKIFYVTQVTHNTVLGVGSEGKKNG